MMLLINLLSLFALVAANLIPLKPTGQNHPDKFLKTIEEKVYYYPQQAETMLDSLMSTDFLRIKKDQPGELAFIQAYIAYHKGDSDKAIGLLDTALLTFIHNDWPEGQAKCYLLMGWIAEGDNYLEQAIIYFYETIRLLNDQPSADAGLAYLGLARCKKILKEEFSGDLNLGMEYLYKSRKPEFALYARFTNLMFNIDQSGSTKQLLDMTYQYNELGLNKHTSGVYKVLADYYFRNNDQDSALFYADKAIQSYDENYPGKSLLPALHQMKGNIYLKQNNFKAAREELILSIELYKAHDQLPRSFYAYDGMYSLEYKKGNYKAATDNLTIANKYRYQNSIKEKQRMAKAMETTAKVTVLTEQISKLKKDKLLQQGAFILLFTFVMIIAVLIFRKRKLTKSSFIAEIQSKIISNEKDQLLIKLLKNNDGEFLQYLEKNFDHEQFKDFYPLLSKFMSKFSDKLSTTDQLLGCMLILDCSQETISKVLNVQQDSVRKIKQRMRNKLGIEKDCDLGFYLKKQISYKSIIKMKN